MSWNYRVVKEEYEGEPYYFIKEVYYDKDGEIEAIAEDPIRLDGLTIEDIKEDIYLVGFAFSRDVIDFNEVSKDWDLDD